jgi:hypothetical protein
MIHLFIHLVLHLMTWSQLVSETRRMGCRDVQLPESRPCSMPSDDSVGYGGRGGKVSG